ncbi:MAG: hypothetical protein JSS25_05255 [Proteobacteria bacterium]|nr:hypothetical protein [Pseudomonadota bacterium]
MRGYGERDFVRALVPLLISKLPNPLSPSEEDMGRVADATERWVELLVDLRTNPKWEEFLLDWNNQISWKEADYDLEPDEPAQES